MADEGKEKKGCCEKLGDGLSNFAKFLFNRETGQVMGRSGESWLKIGFFYLIFYGFLAAFFSAMLTVFLKTLENPEDGGAPKLTQFIENKPGLSHIKIGKSLAAIRGADKNATLALATSYNKTVTTMLKKYAGDACGDSPTGMPKDKECVFNTTLLSECGLKGAPDYGITDQKPCVYVKMNKVFNWVPKPTPGSGNFLQLTCGSDEGITVMPAGFHIGSFPFRGQSGYELPIVAVKIDLKKFTKDKVVCSLKGPNIEVSESSVPHRAFAKVEIS